MSYQRYKKNFHHHHHDNTKKEGWKSIDLNFKEWKSVEQGALNIFHGKKLPNSEFVKIFETIRSISLTEVGVTFILQSNYEEKILKRGMQTLRDEIKEKPGHAFLEKLGELWTNFYTNILPILQSLFYSLPTQGMNVKQMTLLSFRDIVLLQLKVDEALSADDFGTVPKSIKQMFCVLLQAVRDNSDNYLKLEALTSRVINPLLGTKGLYVRSEVKEHHESKSDRYSMISLNAGTTDSSPEVAAKSSDSCSDADLEELMNHRRQQTRFNGGMARLSCVEEREGSISESLASVIGDGFEIR